MKTSLEFFERFQTPETLAGITYFDTVADMWRDRAARYADRTAVVYDGVSHSYAELDADVASYRGVLLANGLTKSDRVCLFSPNSYDFIKAYLAAVTMGITVAVLPPMLDERSVFGLSMKFAAKAVLYFDPFAEKTRFAGEHGVKCISLTATADPADADTGLTAKDPCVIMLTGGTTGASKGALLSHGAVMNGTVNGCYGYEPVFEQRYLLVLPLFHVFGLIRNLMTSLYTGSALFICKNNQDMFRDMAVFKPTIWVVVPAVAEMALGLSRRFGRNMLGPDMKTIIVGAAPVPPYLITAYRDFGIKVCPGYGLTESANLVSGNPDPLGHPESCGLLYPNQDIRIVDGELWLKGDNMMDGYVGSPAENEAAYSDGWFRTGDLVRLDEDGYLYIVGRIKEILLLSNGENIAPAEIEAFFYALPTVQDAQVFETRSDDGRIILALEVVPRASELAKSGASDPAEFLMSQLTNVNASLPAGKRVEKIVIRDTDFERTPSLKIKRYPRVGAQN